MLLGSVVSLAVLALLAPFVSRALGRFGWLMALGPAAVFVLLAGRIDAVAGGQTFLEHHSWVEGLGISLSFRLDGLSLLFGLLIVGIGALVTLYATGYFAASSHGPAHPLRHRFFAYLFGFMVSMLGLVTADNLMLLFVFWELTSITSYLLIGFDHDRATARKSALQALVVTGLGGLAMLAGLILLALIAGAVVDRPGGVWELSEILTIAQTHDLTASGLYPAALACLLAGAITKSAQFPFHFWLPNAMEAPTPVSAYLHSSTMVKAGVYLIMRLNPAFAGHGEASGAWVWSLVIFGGITMLVGAVLAARETYFKRALAYSTISSLGIMIFCTGVGGDYGVQAGVTYLLAHAFFKACLFLVAGSVTHETGSKDTEALGGLSKHMPIISASALVGALSMAGAPILFFGFLGKEFLIKAAMKPGGPIEGFGPLLTIAVFAAAALTVMISLLVGFRPFYRPPRPRGPADEPVPHGHEPPIAMWLGPAVLAVLTVIAPIAPGIFAEPVVGAGMDAVGGAVFQQAEAIAHGVQELTPDPAHTTDHAATHASAHDAHNDHHALHLGFWHALWPLTWALALSIAALALGAWMYAARNAWRPGVRKILAAFDPVGPLRTYDRAFDGVMAFAGWQTRVLQNGKLRRYIATTIGVAVALVGLAMLRAESFGLRDALPPIRDFATLDLALLSLMVVAAVAATRMRSRLAAVATLGVVGYAVAVTFVVLGVPDIAMTQFSIETLTVVIFVLVIYHLPRFRSYSPWRNRATDWGLGVAFGGLLSTMVLVASGIGGTRATDLGRVSERHGEWAYIEAHGRNVVNVILVDFRGLDTMGEIGVLGIAAIGVFTLLRLRRERATIPATGPQPDAGGGVA